MLLKRFLQMGIAGLALGNSASAADPDTMRLGRTEARESSVTALEAPANEDTELVRGRHGYYGGHRGYYGGGSYYGRSYYGGGYGGGYYGGGYYGGGYGGGYYGGGYYGGGYGGGYYGGGYYGNYYPRSSFSIGFGYGGYSYPTYYYSTPVYYYGCSGSDAPTVNLGKSSSQPLASPMEMAPPSAPSPVSPQRIQPSETLKVNLTSVRPAIQYPAYGE